MMTAKKEPAPYLPPKYEDYHVFAFQALQRGDATQDQQKLVLSFLVNSLCATYDMSYRSSSERDTAFAEGRRFVGCQIVKLLNLDLLNLKKEKLNERRTT